MEKLHQQWDTIMNMNVYDFQNILKSYNDILEERKKEEDKQMMDHGYDESKYNPDYMMSQARKSMPKVQTPSINIPKF